MDMARRAPRTGHPLIDNLLIVAWVALAGANQWMTVSQLADLMVAIGAALTAFLTALRIYQHLAGETILSSILDWAGSEEQEAET